MFKLEINDEKGCIEVIGCKDAATLMSDFTRALKAFIDSVDKKMDDNDAEVIKHYIRSGLAVALAFGDEDAIKEIMLKNISDLFKDYKPNKDKLN